MIFKRTLMIDFLIRHYKTANSYNVNISLFAMLPAADFGYHNCLVTNILQNILRFVTHREHGHVKCLWSQLSIFRHVIIHLPDIQYTNMQTHTQTSRTELLHQNCSAWKGKPPTWHHKTQYHSTIINHIASPWPKNTAHFTHFTLM